MLALIEHLFNQKHVIDEVKMALKPDGLLLITTPTPFGNDIIHSIGAKVGLFAKSACYDHIVIYNEKRFKILANEVEMKLVHYEETFG